MFALVMMAILVSSASPNTHKQSTTTMSLSRRYKWCVTMKDEYNVLPGKSFGSLPARLHNEYLNARCFEFFCEPHPTAGKGVFDCVPLPQEQFKHLLVEAETTVATAAA